MALFFALTSGAEEKRGVLALAFDDGYPSWTSIIAPELKAVGGTATGYVNNDRIRNGNPGNLSYNDLLTLQNKYGWEIGTHTYHHSNPAVFVRTRGLKAWLEENLDASINELRAKGLAIRSLVFPFNQSTKELQTEVLKRVSTFRRDDSDPLAYGKDSDGSVPGKAIDIGHYTAMAKIKRMIDKAHDDDEILFLYGHQVLPDSDFATGEVFQVSRRGLIAKSAIPALSNPYLCLAPDMNKEIVFTVMVERIEGNAVFVSNGDLTRYTGPGAKFMIGPCMGLRLSDFREMIRYASEKLYFKTVSGAVEAAPPFSAIKSGKAD